MPSGTGEFDVIALACRRFQLLCNTFISLFDVQIFNKIIFELHMEKENNI